MEIKSKMQAIEVLSYSVLNVIDTEFLQEALEDKLDKNQMVQLLNIWYKVEKDFFRFYSAVSNPQLLLPILDALKISSFSSEISQYIYFCNSSTPIILKDISSSAWQTVNEYDINHYGNFSDWAVFWLNTTETAREEFLSYIEQKKEENRNNLHF